MKIKRWTLIISFLFCLPICGWAEQQQYFFGTVHDAVSGAALSGIEVRTSDTLVWSDVDGRFKLETAGENLIVRAPGYRPKRISLSAPLSIQLQPITPKALYLSYWAADSQQKRLAMQQLLTDADMNALVIDIKTSRGDIAYRSKVPLAAAVKAQRVRTLKDLPEFLEQLKAQGIYTIARIVVFKDNRLAKGRPGLAVHELNAQIWEDREKLSWSDPFNPLVWEYNLAIAEEVAALGVDEIQFDYIRFPAKSDLVFSKPNTGENRVAAINGFLQQAKQRLANYPVMISANIFGYICWKHKDNKIGQRLVDLAESVDYLAPMLYPSGFPRGIPGYKNPLANPYQVIANSLQKAQQLSGLSAVRFRPWLQAFRDYAFDRRSFKAEAVNAQINASDAVGSNGWMLWNASSRFSLAGLRQQIPLGELKLADASPTAEATTMLTQAEAEKSPPEPLPALSLEPLPN